MSKSSNKVNFIFSGSLCVKVNFENEAFADKVLGNDFIVKYIPGFKIANESDVYEAEITFQNKDTCFEFDRYPQISIGSNQLSDRDAISLIELVLERSRQEKGIYCIHSATVIYDNKAVIFWGGASGMGKTRLARTFVEKGAKFYSDEKTLIDLNTFEVVGGIPFQYLEKSFWRTSRNSKQGGDPYLRVDTMETETNYPIGCFVYGFGIDNAVISSEKWTPEKFEWHLYEELGRKIRAISRKVVNGEISVPAIDSQINGDKRIRLVKESARIVDCYSIQGSPEAVVGEVIEIIENNGKSKP